MKKWNTYKYIYNLRSKQEDKKITGSYWMQKTGEVRWGLFLGKLMSSYGLQEADSMIDWYIISSGEHFWGFCIGRIIRVLSASYFSVSLHLACWVLHSSTTDVKTAVMDFTSDGNETGDCNVGLFPFCYSSSMKATWKLRVLNSLVFVPKFFITVL